MVKLTFLGHSAYQIETESTTLLIDPFITGNPQATIKSEDLKPDYIIITHGHGDHIGDSVDIAKASGATIIANDEIANHVTRLGAKAEHMHIGGKRDFPFGSVKLTIAHHGSGLQDGEDAVYLGSPAGVVLTVDGKSIYHAGDTGLFLDMKLIGELHDLNVALLPIGDNFTMGVSDAVVAADFLKADLTVPMHYNTWDIINADPIEFVNRVQALNIAAKIVKPGESFEI